MVHMVTAARLKGTPFKTALASIRQALDALPGEYIQTAAGQRISKDRFIQVMSQPEIQAAALPEGFRFLVTDNLELVEPVLLFLYSKFVCGAKSQAVGNTQEAYCADLYEWHLFLEGISVPWNEATKEHAIRYRLSLEQSVSPVTGRPYARSTIIRRLTVIQQFYLYAFKCGWVKAAFGKVRWVDDTGKVHVHDVTDGYPEIDPSIAAADLIPKKKTTISELIRAIQPKRILPLLHELGADIRELDMDRTDLRPTRDRLFAEVGLTTGLRPDENENLTVNQILALEPQSDDDYEMLPLHVTKTKGLKARTVMLPYWLYKRLIWYIENERTEVIQEARRRGKFRKREPRQLFLNGLRSNDRDIGEPFSADTFRENFNAAQVRLGHVHTEEIADPETGEVSEKVMHDHTPHDLRHTFAVQQYFTLARKGVREPWVHIQLLLGHADVQTTIDTYLASVNAMEAHMSDTMLEYHQKLRAKHGA